MYTLKYHKTSQKQDISFKPQYSSHLPKAYLDFMKNIQSLKIKQSWNN